MARNSVAFEAAVEGISGASCKVGDGETFDIAAALKDGKGQIVLDLAKPEDQEIANALRNHPAVKEATAKTPKKEG